MTAAALALDFSNANTLWASVLVESLWRSGVRQAVVSPGSRSSPLTIALARHAGIGTIPVLDERSAAFFALGLALRSARPVVLLCTSGTAGAHYFPAVIEAKESGVPLLILTADRPPELRDCASGQTIDQQKFFGGYVTFYHELAVPEAHLELLRYLRQTVAQALRIAVQEAGPVHLNIPLRDPLVPLPDAGQAQGLSAELGEAFFAHLAPPSEMTGPGGGGSNSGGTAECKAASRAPIELPFAELSERGVIIAGPQLVAEPARYAAELAQLARALGWPILADGVSPLRHHSLGENACEVVVVTTYDAILRSEAAAVALRPQQVLCFGSWPTSKVLRAWLSESAAEQVLVSPQWRNRDGLHGHTRQLRAPSAAQLCTPQPDAAAAPSDMGRSAYAQLWLRAEQAAAQVLRDFAAVDVAGVARGERPPTVAAAGKAGSTAIFEGAVISSLARALPARAAVFVASSMPIRDVEYFWPRSECGYLFYFNRGANGIDGTLSSALGVAHASAPPAATANESIAGAAFQAPPLTPTFLLCGDLAFLHDSGGLALAGKLRGSLTVVLVNNSGGGIFEHLPVASYEPPFEEFFATPQDVDFAKLCAAHEVEHRLLGSLAELEAAVSQAPRRGLRVLQLRTNRKYAAARRKALFALAAQTVSAAI